MRAVLTRGGCRPLPDLKRVDHVPAPYRDGWTFTAPVIEMPIYLGWMRDRLERAGGTVTRMALHALPEPNPSREHPTMVINCAGIGARALSGDLTVTPVRGQVVCVEQFGLEEWTLDAAGPTYVIPRSRDIVVGGTDTEGAWEPRPDPQTASEIIERASALVPELAQAKVLAHRVGLRPARPTVRLEDRDDTSWGDDRALLRTWRCRCHRVVGMR